jgi:hypothetical protein
MEGLWRGEHERDNVERSCGIHAFAKILTGVINSRSYAHETNAIVVVIILSHSLSVSRITIVDF